MQTPPLADWTDPPQARLHILIADDHTALRKGVRQIVLGVFPDAEVGEAANGLEVLEAVQSGDWHLLILDLSMPERSGLEILPALRQGAPQLRILVLTVHAERDYGLRLMKSGVSGYLTKDRSAEEMEAALRKVASGGKYVSPVLADCLAELFDGSPNKLPHETLSAREFQVMQMIASGLSVAEIAQALSLHTHTVAAFRRQILRKLSVKTTQDIAFYAIRAGLVDWPKAA